MLFLPQVVCVVMALKRPRSPPPEEKTHDLITFLRTINTQKTGLENHEWLEADAITAFWLATIHEFHTPECFWLDSMILPPLMMNDGAFTVDEDVLHVLVENDYKHRWMAEHNVLSARTHYWLLPLNINAKHWVLVEIQSSKGSCVLYDSLEDPTLTGEMVVRHLQPWISAWCAVAGVTPLVLNECVFSAHRFTQNDVTSCGVAVCMNMYYRASMIHHHLVRKLPSCVLTPPRIRRFRLNLWRAIALRGMFTASSVMYD